jgi:hypothetical protein
MPTKQDEIVAALKAGGEPTGKLREWLLKQSESVRVPRPSMRSRSPLIARTRIPDPPGIWEFIDEHTSALGYKNAYSPEATATIPKGVIVGDPADNKTGSPPYTILVVPATGEFSMAALVVSPDLYPGWGWYAPETPFPDASVGYTDISAKMFVSFYEPGLPSMGYTELRTTITLGADHVAPVFAHTLSEGVSNTAVYGFLDIALSSGFNEPSAGAQNSEEFMYVGATRGGWGPNPPDVALPFTLSVQMPYDGKSELFAVGAVITVLCFVQEPGNSEVSFCDFRIADQARLAVTTADTPRFQLPDGSFGPTPCPLQITNIAMYGRRPVQPA